MTQAELEAALRTSICTVDEAGRLIHPGLPVYWATIVVLSMVLIVGWLFFRQGSQYRPTYRISLDGLPVIGGVSQYLTSRPLVLLVSKVLVAGLFLLIIFAGLYGTPLPERNLATVLTWNIWWAGLIISILFVGSAWCAVCPWDTLANLLVRHKLWGRADAAISLNLRVPKFLRSVWPALLLLVGLTWLELGVGVTTSPYATAVLALTILVLATVSMALFERKAFCRYFCPVGRTVGAYSQLAPVELRPIETDICAKCTTLECYHGTQTVEPCPTHLVMGRLNQNTYCTSCGNCARSCPDQNVAWALRSPSSEAMQDGRPHWDEAWFMVGLLGLTGFHGVVMTRGWEDGLLTLGRAIGDSGQVLWAFTFAFAAVVALPIFLYALAVYLTLRLAHVPGRFKKLFSEFAFLALPLAFAYHVAHNLNHVLLEGQGIGELLKKPLGIDTLPLSRIEKLLRGADLLVSQDVLNFLQVAIMILGFLISVRIIERRAKILDPLNHERCLLYAMPLFVFSIVVTAYHLWLLMQPMIMRF